MNRDLFLFNNIREDLTCNSNSKKIIDYNLLKFLIDSYQNFFQFNIKKEKRKNIGLNKLLKKVLPMIIINQKFILDFLDYYIVYPDKSYNFCIKNGLTYFLSLKIKFQIKSYKNNRNNIINSKIETMLISNIPMMTNNGTFVIDGIEKTVVSKLVRSPGIYLSLQKKGSKDMYIAKLVPDVGNEMDFILIDNNFFLKIKFNQISLITILKSLGLDKNDILNEFYNIETVKIESGGFKLKFEKKLFLNSTFPYNILNSLNEVIVYKNNIITLDDIFNIEKNNIEYIDIKKDYLINKFLLNDIYDNSKKILIDSKKSIDDNTINLFIKNNINEIKIIHISTNAHYCVILDLNENNLNFIDSSYKVGNFFRKIGFSFLKEKILSFKKTVDNHCYFDISDICRKKLNFRFGVKNKINYKYLFVEDIINIMKLLISFKDNNSLSDETFNLSNLNLHLIGDILEKKIFDYFIDIKKKVNNDIFFNRKINFSIKSILNFKLLDLIIKNFFILSEYSQYLDQVNSLSELSHKRRVSSFGIIGVSRKYSGFNARDLNISHYSRLCPIETPEGINIGLVSALALYASVSKYKSILAPFLKVSNRRVINKIDYLTAEDESNFFIADSTFKLINNYIKEEEITARYNEQLITVNSKLIDYIDSKSCQILSVCTVLIPFLEYNDSNRALMASNMLKQALPCLMPKSPLIGTGFEKLIGKNTSNVLVSKINGIVSYVDSDILIIKKKSLFKKKLTDSYDFFFIKKYLSSNQNTNISQKVNVNINDIIYPGTVLIDNSCTSNGEIALGQNMLVAFMSWGGYNFEDSIIVSEKVVIDEKYTSLEIINLDIPVYSTDIGSELITRDVYNYNNLNLDNLDSFGIIKIGSLVKEGDLILGKKTPISESDLNKIPEEKLLHSVFLDKLENYEDSSFYLPKNISNGTVSNVKVFFSLNYNLSENDDKILSEQINKYYLKKKKRFYIFLKNFKKELKNFLSDEEDYILMKKKKLKIKIRDLLSISLKDLELNNLFIELKKKFLNFIKFYNFNISNIKNKFFKNLSFNMCKIVRVSIITKKKLQVGDKLSGRHGNKGVISKILPVSEMPYLKNGKTIDMILNPLGITSRMNAGQLLEIHLGFASIGLGWRIKEFLEKSDISLLREFLKKIYIFSAKDDDLNYYTNEQIIWLANLLKDGVPFGVMAFNKFNENHINYLLNLAFENSEFELSDNKKQIYLYDGDSGRRFERPITIGIMYILKLNHLVEDKIHARSVGPYSLITQQPVRGKANLGGQRVGEMEVWALQAYGAAYTLQDMITIKSDDINGRFNLYKNIIDGKTKFVGDRPESFNVMLKNISALGMHIIFI